MVNLLKIRKLMLDFSLLLGEFKWLSLIIFSDIVYINRYSNVLLSVYLSEYFYL